MTCQPLKSARRKTLYLGLTVDGLLCGAATVAQGALAAVELARWLAAHVGGNDWLLAIGLVVAAAVIGVALLAEWDTQVQSAKEVQGGP